MAARATMVAVLALVPVARAAAQDPLIDAPGFKENRAYQELAPFESIDTFSGGLILTFTDLVLPGDAGFDLQFVRVYNSKPGGRFGGPRWHFGIASVPMAIEFPDARGPLGDQEPEPERFYPRLYTADGGSHQAFPADPGPVGPHSTWRTQEFWLYRSAERRVDLPNGLRCFYDPRGYLERIENVYGHLQAELHWRDVVANEPSLHWVAQHVGGQIRYVDFYANEDSPLPHTMVAGPDEERYWIYGVPEWGGRLITSVDPPAGPAWHFDYDLQSGEINAVTTPTGGRIEYEFAYEQFARDQPNDGSPTTVQSRVLKRRTVTGRALAGGVWTYTYNGGDPTVVTGPSGIITRYRYSALGQYGAQARVIETIDPVAGEVQREERTYKPIPYGHGGWTPALPVSPVLEVLETRAIIRGSKRYETTFHYSPHNFGDYGQPQTIVENGDLSRTTSRTFDHSRNAPFGPDAYMPGLVTGESITVGGDTFTKGYGFDDRGFKTGETIHGVSRTFTPDGFGNVGSETDGHNHTTRYTYAWGVRKDTDTPEYDITREVREDGVVTSETRGGDTTYFEYDGLLRRTWIEPPAGSPTRITYAGNGESVSVSRVDENGDSRTDYTLDGFGRVTLEARTPNLHRSYAYDAYGRQTGESLPRIAGHAINGTLRTFDALNRVVLEEQWTQLQDPQAQRRLSYRTFNHANDDVRITDEEGRQTFQDWASFGDPGERRLMAVTDADNQTFGYAYNAIGRLTRVAQPGGSQRTWVYEPGTELLQFETHPESGTTRLTYNAGRLATRTDADGNRFEYTYDQNDRVKTIDHQGSNDYDASFKYNDHDQRTEAKNQYVTSEFHWDEANRLELRVDAVTGAPVVATRYSYTGNGAIKSITYPSGQVIEYDYDTAQRLTHVNRGSSTLLTVSEHHPSGAPRVMRFGNGVQETRDYDDQDRLTDIVSAKGQDARVWLQYEYTLGGNVRTLTNLRTPSQTQTFQYDNLDRLRSSTGPGAGTFEYNALGNRTSTNGRDLVYNPVTQRLDQRHVPNAAPEQYGYNNRGDLTSDGHGIYTYTPFGSLAQATIAGTATTYRYDPDQFRVAKLAPGRSEYFIRGQNGQVLTEGAYTASRLELTDYVYAGSMLVATIKPAPPTHLGLVNATQSVSEGTGLARIGFTVATEGGRVGQTFSIGYRIVGPSGAVITDDLGLLAEGAIQIAANTPDGQVWYDVPIVNDLFHESTEQFTIQLLPESWIVQTTGMVHTLEITDDDPVVEVQLRLTMAAQEVSELAGNAHVALEVSTVPAGYPVPADIEVDFGTVPNVGTATPGVHYTAVPISPLRIQRGQMAQVIPGTVAILDNYLDDPDNKHFQFGFELRSGAAIVGVKRQTITILDDEPVEVRLRMNAASQQVTETVGTAHMHMVVETVPANRKVPQNLVIAYGTVPNVGSAQAGADYQAVPIATLTIPQGTQTPHSLPGSVTILNDTFHEANEDFQVGFSLQSGAATVTTPIQTVTIVSEDPEIRLGLTAATQSVAETAGVAHVALVVNTVPANRPLPHAIQLTFGTVPNVGTAQPGQDYTPVTPARLVIPAGTATPYTVPGAVTIINDSGWEANKYFDFGILLESGAATVTTSTQRITIVNDDPYQERWVGFGAPTAQVAESAGAIGTGVYIWTSDGLPTQVPITFDYGSLNGTAVAGSDFTTATPNPTRVTIPAHTVHGYCFCGPIPITNDALVEGNETFVAGVDIVANAAPGHTRQTITILDDDTAYLNFTAGAQSVSEVAGGIGVTAVVTTATGGATVRNISISYMTGLGNATANQDYAAATGSFVIPAGTPSGTPYSVWVPVIDDALSDPNETFAIGIWPTTPGTAFTGANQTITIVDNDPAGRLVQVDWTTTAQAVGEAAGYAWASARILTANGGPTPQDAWIHGWTQQQNAIANVDYRHVDGWFLIPAGTANGAIVTLPIEIGNDGHDEPWEYFDVNILSAPPPGVVTVMTQNIWIADDDPGPNGFAAMRGEGSVDQATDAAVGAKTVPPPDLSVTPPRQTKKKVKAGAWTLEPPPAATPKTTLTWTKGEVKQ